MITDQDYYYIALFWIKPKERYAYLKMNAPNAKWDLSNIRFPKIYREDIAKYAVFMEDADEPTMFCDSRSDAWAMNPYKVVDVPLIEFENPRYERYWTEYSSIQKVKDVIIDDVQKEEILPVVDTTTEEEITPVIQEEEVITNVIQEAIQEEEIPPVIQETTQEEFTPVIEETTQEEIPPVIQEIHPVIQEPTPEEEIPPVIQEPTPEEEFTLVIEEPIQEKSFIQQNEIELTSTQQQEEITSFVEEIIQEFTFVAETSTHEEDPTPIVGTITQENEIELTPLPDINY